MFNINTDNIYQTRQPQQFHSEEFGNIEVLLIDGKPYFPASETAKILGYKNPRDAIGKHCNEDGVAKRDAIDSLGRKQEIKYISEGNLYRLIIRSKLPSAVRFEKWVFDTVIPSIRKYGVYAATGTLEEMVANPEFAAALLENLQAEQKRNAEMSPKAGYYDRVLQCGNAIPVSLIAKDYGMSAHKFNILLHELGLQYKIAGTWLLYQEYAGKGYTQTRTFHYGESLVALHTCWTQRGKKFLHDYLSGFGIIPLALFLDEVEEYFQTELCEFEEYCGECGTV